MKKQKSQNIFDRQFVAERYHQKGGFAPLRKEKMLEVALDMLDALVPHRATLLELGAGTGHFTRKLIATGRFSKIVVTDGAPAMLTIAQQTLPTEPISLQFDQIDFTERWSERFAGRPFDAVTSTMAVHHAENKEQVFRQVCDVLKPNGVFVLGDHMAGGSALGNMLIDRERAFVILGRDDPIEPDQLAAQIRIDQEKSEREGNLCESVAQYQAYLSSSGFEEVDCVWQDYWMAVFVARKPMAP